jgi:hypothetical protein
MTTNNAKISREIVEKINLLDPNKRLILFGITIGMLNIKSEEPPKTPTTTANIPDKFKGFKDEITLEDAFDHIDKISFN